MARVTTNIAESVYQIKRWRGVNEAQEGEASLEMGEAAVMRNFKVTAGGALQKRGGAGGRAAPRLWRCRPRGHRAAPLSKKATRKAL